MVWRPWVAAVDELGARLAVRSDENSYVVEAAIPLAAIGLAPEPGQVLKMDWGVLTTDDGFVTRSRAYWANPMATGVSDEPTEARLQPHLWGHMRFVESADTKGMPRPQSLDDLLNPAGTDTAIDELMEDLF